MFNPTAQIIADSINLCGDRLTTFVLKYHRMIHSEFMTHRMLSKNSSSSRAIPVEKMIANVIADNVYPLHWGKNQKGMSAREEVDEQTKIDAKIVWNESRSQSIKHARMLVDIGIHKQIVNRILEPYSTITVICSATEYQNFFDQRCHPDAQPEIKALADAMKAEYDASEPRQIKANSLFNWHIPFVTEEDLDQLNKSNTNYSDLLKVSVGRCARVSYLNHDGKRNIQDDIKLHDRLLTSRPAHLSPFEHCAMALGKSEKRANFTGFESYRYQVERR